MTSIHPKKLLLTKWTAVKPAARQKHFLVTRVILPEAPALKIDWVEIEAVCTKMSRRIQWRELRNESVWRQGWV